MESNLEQRMKKYAKKNSRKKIWLKILSVLSTIVVFCTTYALILPAITQERETFCGAEEHIHSERCAPHEEEILICELLEEAGHSHSEECFEKILRCETEENHLHTEECRSGEQLTCEKPEGHIHSEECYETSLLCEIPETEGHTHGEECYETKTVSCEAEEHSHSLACYSDKTADIETEEQWSASFAAEDFGEVVSENLITIAKSQLGYHESTKNYVVLEDGETIKGRTRYGEWFGEPYADWNILFAGFCLDYAKAEIPFDADFEKWIELLSAPETDIYRPANEHEALAGDLIFFDEDSDRKPEKAGIITEITEAGYKTVIGDYGDSVQSVIIGKADETIFGFAAIAIPSPYHCGMEEHIHDNCFDENGNLSCGFAEHVHTDECLIEKAEETEPEYFCGTDEHLHTEECFDENGEAVCGMEEHAHTEECLAKKTEPEYFCGMAEHAHTEECFGENGEPVCGMEEHAHTEECLTEKTEPEYFCGTDEHLHTEECFDENGEPVCGMEEHAHTEECLAEKTEPEYFCGMDEHLHTEECLDENDENICGLNEHLHDAGCLTEKEEKEFWCGFDEHAHTEECFGENGEPTCGMEEHSHTDNCRVSLESLTEEEKARIEEVIKMIEELPTPDEIDLKIEEFEEAEDYEGEEAWLTEIYRQAGLAYKYYTDLPENHRQFVTNSEKLMELEYIWSMAILIEMEIADTIDYSSGMFTGTRAFVLYTKGANGYYAFDGTGKAVPINIDSNGVITANVNSRNELLWTFEQRSTNTYLIKNLSSGRYMHTYSYGGGAITTSGSYQSTIVTATGGVKIRSNSSDYARLDEAALTFLPTTNANAAAVYNFGVYDTANQFHIWLDGTNGGMDYLAGSDDIGYSVKKGEGFILPESWKTPDGYSYKIQGWYDIIDGKYYSPGTEIFPTKNTVFYADWIPASYDIGQFNASVSPTVSTSDFITTRVYDYSPFFNFPYVNANVTVDASGHSETWSIKTNQKGAGNLIFRDWSGGKLSYPNNSNSGDNEYTGDNTNPNLLSAEVRERIFGTGPGVPGRNYLGTGDHLFQYCDDPDNTEYYGYYYYDSLYHAASYNQQAGRFYIYDYLERATDSSTADFLPLNSPYVNTNGRPVTTYSNSGQYDEYNGTTHYQYTGGSGVNSEYWFGLKTDIEFFLPSDPGGKDSEGNNVNQGLNGKDLVFDFTGDDDVWVFVDDILVLDIGGIHNALEGSINFSTGVVTVNGSTSALPDSIGAGEHTLTMYYLERGASQSNCKIKFNITTRYHLKIMKEDVLTRELLDGAEFTVYTDEACTKEALLWESEAANKAGAEGQSTFVVKNGVANMWGLASGNTYYIKETKYPANGGYGVANGIIVMQLNSLGTATFDVIPNPDAEGSDLSGGFTVHGFKIDVENHEAYLVATNGKEEYGDEVTSVTVVKEWNDNIDHSKDSITVYILANGFRIQEAVLSEANNWTHTWKNLPVKGDSGKPVTYTVEEGTVPGYFGTITPLVSSGGGGEFKQVSSFTDGKNYVIVSNDAPLYATESEGIKRNWNISIPQYFTGAKWTADVNGNTVSLTNELGLTLYYSNSGGNRFYSVSKNPPGGTNLSFVDNKLAYIEDGKLWYMSWNEGETVPVDEWGGPTVVLYEESGGETVTNGFLITNEPVTVDNSVSFRVNKAWNTGNFASIKDYEQLVVTMKLLENEKDSGMSADLSIKNGWTYTFKDLPKFDSGGKEIVYSVEEVFISSEWRPEYGEITLEGNRYETTVTNVYRMHYELPQTGGGGTIFNIAGGIFAFGAGFALIYRVFKKRRKEDTS